MLSELWHESGTSYRWHNMMHKLQQKESDAPHIIIDLAAIWLEQHKRFAHQLALIALRMGFSYLQAQRQEAITILIERGGAVRKKRWLG